MQSFTAWLAATPASVSIQSHGWIIPTVQSVHILAIAVVLSCVLMINLRLARLAGRGATIVGVMGRFMPWLWAGLATLLASGSVLIIGEPARELLNSIFYLKMVLLAAVVAITLVLERPVRGDDQFWEDSQRLVLGRALALIALALWVCIVFCGRWIAYAWNPSV